MIVGDDIPVLADDDAGTGCMLVRRLLLEFPAAAVAEEVFKHFSHRILFFALALPACRLFEFRQGLDMND